MIIQLQADLRGNKIIFAIEERVPDMVYTDLNRLSQVLINLLSNANKFTKKGRISVQIALLRVKTKAYIINQRNTDSFLKIKVVDSGIGISEADAAQLFQPFVCLEKGKYLNPNGIGLGLSICKAVLQ